MKVAALLLFIFACSTKPTFERGPLKDLVLRPRKGFQDKLTNRRCIERKKYSDTCLKYDTTEYDFNDANVRKLLRDLKFLCNVNGVQYGVCPTARGLCQLTKETSGIWPFRTTTIKLNKYLSLHDDYELLIQSDTYCASLNSDVGHDMFE
jgi:hypothetical protein